MTSVNVTLQKNKVSVTNQAKSTTVEVPKTSVVQAVTQGPQGPQGAAGSNFTLTDSAKVDKSIVYYDSSAGVYKADTTWTTTTLTDGGSF